MIKRRNNGLKNKNIQKNLEITKIKCHLENNNLIREFSQTFYVLCPFRTQRSWLSIISYLLSIYKPSLSMVFTVSLYWKEKKKKVRNNLFCYFSIKNILAAKNKRVIPKAIEMINFTMFKINVRQKKKKCYLLLCSCKASMMSQRDICSKKVSSTSTETWVFPLLRIQSVSKAKEGFKSLLNFSNLDFL